MFEEGLKLLLLKSLLCVIVHAKTFCELLGWVILQAPSDLSNPVLAKQKADVYEWEQKQSHPASGSA